MSRCERCTAIYTKGRYKNLCPVCADRLAMKFYADASTPADFKRRHQQRIDGLRGMTADYNRPRGVHVTTNGMNGICSKCNRAIDDHSLTHSKEPYPVAICPEKKVEPPKPSPDDTWMYE